MDLSCFPGQTSAIGVPLRFDSVDLGIIHIVTSSLGVLVAAFTHVIKVFTKKKPWALERTKKRNLI